MTIVMPEGPTAEYLKKLNACHAKLERVFAEIRSETSTSKEVNRMQHTAMRRVADAIERIEKLAMGITYGDISPATRPHNLDKFFRELEELWLEDVRRFKAERLDDTKNREIREIN